MGQRGNTIQNSPLEKLVKTKIYQTPVQVNYLDNNTGEHITYEFSPNTAYKRYTVCIENVKQDDEIEEDLSVDFSFDFSSIGGTSELTDSQISSSDFSFDIQVPNALDYSLGELNINSDTVSSIDDTENLVTGLVHQGVTNNSKVIQNLENSLDSITDNFNIPDTIMSNLTLTEAWSVDNNTEEDTSIQDETSNEKSDNTSDPLMNDFNDPEAQVDIIYTDDEDIKIIHKGEYLKDYYIRDKGLLVYDEIIYKSDKNTLSKWVVGDDSIVEEVTLKVNPLTSFEASTGIQTLSKKPVNVNGSFLVVTEYINDKGEVLIETISPFGSIVKQSYKYNGIEIELSYLKGNTSYGVFSWFGKKKFPIDYTNIELVTNKQKKKSGFTQKSNYRSIYLPNVEYFKSKLHMDFVERSNYEIVDTSNRLIDIVDMLMREENKDRVIAYDAETQGLRFYRYLQNHHQLVTHSLSWEDHQSIIVPVRMRYEQNIDPREASEILKPLLETRPILAHNGAADVRFLRYDGINLNLQEDTIHLIKHITPFINHKEFMPYGKALEDLVYQAFGLEMINLKKYVFDPCGAPFDFSMLNRDYMIYYGCPDTDLDRMLWKLLRPHLDPRQELAYKNTVYFSKNVANNSTFCGLGVNAAHIKEEKKKSVMLVDKLKKLMYGITKQNYDTLSFTSSVQKSNYIFTVMKAPISYARKTSKGALSADKVVIDRLSKVLRDGSSTDPDITFKEDIVDASGEVIVTKEELNRIKYPFCKLLRIHDDLVKNITAFYNGILNTSIELGDTGKYIYPPDFRIGTTDTWRTTDRVQITKKNIKYELGKPSDSYGWFSTDYAAEEFRLAVNQSEDYVLMDLLTDPEADPHTMVASELHEIPPYKVTKDIRTGIKTANFGIIYGMKVKALAQNIYRTDIPTEEQLKATEVLYNLYCYKRAVMLKELERAKNFVADVGYIHNKLSYKMIYEQIIDLYDSIDQCFSQSNLEITPKIDYDKKYRNLGGLLNACGNYPIQSWAAGILMVVYNAFCKRLQDEGFTSSVSVPLQVHDEVGGYFWLDNPSNDEIMTELELKPVHPYHLIKMQNETMCCSLDYLNKSKYAPLYIGVGFGDNWGQAKGDNEEIPVALQKILISEWENGTCPTWQEIREEGLHSHFMRRNKEYMIQRLHDIFQDMYEAKHFNRQEMQHRLNTNMFVGKKVNELFGTNNKSGEIIIERYLELIYNKSVEEIKELGVTWEEGEPIVDDSDRVLDENEVQEFFFRETELHPRVILNEDTFTVDITNLYAPIAKNVLTYLYGLENKEYNYHNKRILIQNGLNIEYTNRYILGVPSNFNEVLDRILQGEKIQYTFNPNLGYEVLTTIPTLVAYNNAVILHVKDIQQVSVDLLPKISNVLTKYVSTAMVATIPILVQGDTLTDTGLRLISITPQMQDEIERVIVIETSKQQQVQTVNDIVSPETVSLDAAQGVTLNAPVWGK